MDARPGSEQSRNVLGITLEEYFHVGAFRDLIARGRWYRFEPRLEAATNRALDLLAQTSTTATCFAHGWVAERYPELLRRVVEHGHEIGNSGYAHRGLRELSADALVDEFARSRELLESASGVRVRGTRVPDWIAPRDLPLLERLADAGYDYDASLRQVATSAGADHLVPFELHHGGRTIWEFPVPTASFAGFRVPIGGGNWFRQLPANVVRRAVSSWMRTHDAPFSMYFQAWELDPEQPRITAASWITRIRHYRNLDRMTELVREFLRGSRFTSFAEFLGLPLLSTTRSTAAAGLASTPEIVFEDDRRPVVAVVVPCYNEAETLPYLMNTLASVERRFADRYRFHFVFVDDASADETWQVLSGLVAARSNCTVVRHPVNRGVAHAILTGISASPSELVCSIDADCTYDPHEIGRLVDALEHGAALVTASPYHPEGHVVGVPKWRLALSRTLSSMYRRVLDSDLHTYTSCFRGYRKSAFMELTLRHRGFLGVAETLARTILSGEKVVEIPATLESRLIGQSKMRVLPVIVGHLRLLAEISRLPRPAEEESRHRSEAMAIRA
jgi:polysaccharide deacetylase family protein (PEP-CTERM system associated)